MTADYRAVALHNAHNGHAVFAVQPDKTPYPGETSWEQRANSDRNAVNRMWDLHPEALPAVAPGVAHRTVIDVDRKSGKADGFDSLALHGLDLEALAEFAADSLSGLGRHYWFAGRVGSLNHVLPGVDRKSRGGYVVTPYLLPPAWSLTVPAPSVLLGTKVGARVATGSQYRGDARSWLEAHTTGRTLSREVTRAVLPYVNGEPFAGHDVMLRFQTYLVKLATEGHNGVPEALAFARDVWVASPHSSDENPATEWDNALDRAIANYGGPRR